MALCVTDDQKDPTVDNLHQVHNEGDLESKSKYVTLGYSPSICDTADSWPLCAGTEVRSDPNYVWAEWAGKWIACVQARTYDSVSICRYVNQTRQIRIIEENHGTRD